MLTTSQSSDLPHAYRLALPAPLSRPCFKQTGTRFTALITTPILGKMPYAQLIPIPFDE
jgi:hypothetical protein